MERLRQISGEQEINEISNFYGSAWASHLTSSEIETLKERKSVHKRYLANKCPKDILESDELNKRVKKITSDCKDRAIENRLKSYEDLLATNGIKNAFNERFLTMKFSQIFRALKPSNHNMSSPRRVTTKVGHLPRSLKFGGNFKRWRRAKLLAKAASLVKYLMRSLIAKIHFRAGCVKKRKYKFLLERGVRQGCLLDQLI